MFSIRAHLLADCAIKQSVGQGARMALVVWVYDTCMTCVFFVFMVGFFGRGVAQLVEQWTSIHVSAVRFRPPRLRPRAFARGLFSLVKFLIRIFILK